MAKLTKAQKEFFDKFAKNILTNTILMDMGTKGFDVTDEVVEQVQKLVDQQNVDSLVNAVGAALLERVEFKTLVKVEKFLNTEEARTAMQAAQEVGASVQEELYGLIHDMFTAAPSEA